MHISEKLLKIRRVLVSAVLVSVLSISPAHQAMADWRLESVNSLSGVSAYATTYWINGVGPVNYYGLTNSNLEYETYFATMMIQCSKKKYIVTMTLLQTGSAHESMSLDDPGYIRLQFQNLSTSKKYTYRTVGLGMDGVLAVSANSQALVSNLAKSRTVKMQFIKRSGKTLSAVFDTRDLVSAKTRFAYAGCKL